VGTEKKEILHFAQASVSSTIMCRRKGLELRDVGLRQEEEAVVGQTLDQFEEGEMVLFFSYKTLGDMAQNVGRESILAPFLVVLLKTIGYDITCSSTCLTPACWYAAVLTKVPIKLRLLCIVLTRHTTEHQQRSG